jgi:hypothetical protein
VLRRRQIDIRTGGGAPGRRAHGRRRSWVMRTGQWRGLDQTSGGAWSRGLNNAHARVSGTAVMARSLHNRKRS